MEALQRNNLQEVVAHLEEMTPSVRERAGVDVNQVKVFKAHLPNLARQTSNFWAILLKIFIKVFLPEDCYQQIWLGLSDVLRHSSP